MDRSFFYKSDAEVAAGSANFLAKITAAPTDYGLVAAQATAHLVVTKDQSKDRAVVTIEPIQATRKARVSELARMLGDRNAKSAIAHAEELLGKS